MTKEKPIFLPRMSEAIFSLLRDERFWNPVDIEGVISNGEDIWPAADIEKVLMHHRDFKRFAQVPACDRCNPILNKSQTCRHPGRYYVYKMILGGVAILEQHEKRQGKKENPPTKGEKK